MYMFFPFYSCLSSEDTIFVPKNQTQHSTTNLECSSRVRVVSLVRALIPLIIVVGRHLTSSVSRVWVVRGGGSRVTRSLGCCSDRVCWAVLVIDRLLPDSGGVGGI